MKLEIASNEVESMIRADECTFLIMYVLWIIKWFPQNRLHPMDSRFIF